MGAVKVNVNGVDETLYLQRRGMTFNNSDPAAAEQVTLGTECQQADFGVFSKTEETPSTAPGSEYYSQLAEITAMTDNASIVGNAKANFVTLHGGSDNYLVGGIGADNIFFEGGGVITDFGIGITKNGGNKVLATTTKRTNTSTYVGFNRDDPTSYAQGTDTLKVDGEVVEIAFRQDGGDYDSSTESTFTVYVTYVAGGKYSTIALANIAKKATTTNKNNPALAVYCSNLEQAQGFTASGTSVSYPSIYDTSTGTSERLMGTALTSLFVDKSNSAYSSAIARLDAIIQARGITTYSTTAPYKITSVSNGIVAAYNAAH